MKSLAAQFCQRALHGIEQLPAAERADHLEFAADVLGTYDLREMSQAAKAAAADLRNAEASQLKFQALLSSAINQNIVP